MARSYITTTAPTQVMTNYCRKVLIQINAALTGTITVGDGLIASNVTCAVITNPTVGQRYEYWDFMNGVVVTASATCDITVNADGSYGAK